MLGVGSQTLCRTALTCGFAEFSSKWPLDAARRLVDLTARIEELDEELSAAREANRGLMAVLNRP